MRKDAEESKEKASKNHDKDTSIICVHILLNNNYFPFTHGLSSVSVVFV